MSISSKKALIVDDNLVLSYLYESYLERLGFVVESHMVYGKTAITFAKEQRPDFILMDIMLEGDIDGIEAVTEIQKELTDLPVIYITSNPDPEFQKRSEQTHYIDFLTKPIEFEDLKDSLEPHFKIPG